MITLLHITVFWLLASRLTGFFILAPGVQDLEVPKLVRVAVIVWLACFMTPLVAQPPAVDLSWSSLIAGVTMEFLFGLGRGGVMGRVLMLVGLAYFWASDYLSALLVGVEQSFRVLPLGSVAVTHASLDLMVRLCGELFEAGLIIAAPIAILVFIVTMALGFLSRSVQQLNVFGESFVIRVMVGGAGVVFLLPLLLLLSRFSLERMLPAAADYFRAMS
jgi:flagellar biosynthesis protein FliR